SHDAFSRWRRLAFAGLRSRRRRTRGADGQRLPASVGAPRASRAAVPPFSGSLSARVVHERGCAGDPGRAQQVVRLLRRGRGTEAGGAGLSSMALAQERGTRVTRRRPSLGPRLSRVNIGIWRALVGFLLLGLWAVAAVFVG